MDNFNSKYIKYKKKYINLKNQLVGGATAGSVVGSTEIISSESLIRLISQLENISKHIDSIFNSEDKAEILFLCVGASPAYLYTHLNTCYNYNVINIPLSGLSHLFKPEYYPTISLDQRRKFCDYLNKFMKLSYWPRYTMRKLIIIDHSHTGESISNFVNLLQSCIFKFDEIQFCNLVDVKTPVEMVKPPSVPLDKIHIIRGEGINDVSGHILPRSIKQIHFTTIIKSTDEEINALILDTTDLEKGLVIQKLISSNCKR